LAAFKRAADSGADALEFDLHLTRDGHFVVFHDLLANHPSLGPTPVPELTLGQMKELRLGDSEEKVPTFEEVAECFRKSALPLIPELKTPEEARRRGLDPVSAFCRDVDRLEISQRVVVQCFHASTLDELRARKPELELLALYRHDQLVDLEEVPGRAEYLGLPMLGVFFFGRKLVEKAHSRGVRVVPWREMAISENKEVFDRLAEFGVHAVMVDDADQALIHYQRRPAPPDFKSLQRCLLFGETPAQSRRCRKPV
jgi:glycerophosphoryl diester phosphodiesterase